MSSFNRYVAPVLFPSVLWHTNESSVHLTFDDGPHPSATPKVLEILNRRKIKATFFLVGESVQLHSNLAREISAAGHSIGNHTLAHQMMFLRSKSIQQHQIHQTNAIIEESLGLKPRYFRPPYGYFDFQTLRLAKAEGHRVVMWDVDARDFAVSRPDSLIRAVLRETKPGSILLFHDNESTAPSLDRYLGNILDQLEQNGFQLSPLP